METVSFAGMESSLPANFRVPPSRVAQAVTLRVADDLQANLIKENFMDNPTLLYQSVIALLTGKVRPSFDGNSVTLDLK